MLKLLPSLCLLVLCQSRELEYGGDLDALLEHFATQVPVTTEPNPQPDVETMVPENARRRREAVDICTTKYGEIGNCVFYKTCNAEGESYDASVAGSTCSKWDTCCALKDINPQLGSFN